MCGLGKLVRSAALATFVVGAGLAQAAPEAPGSTTTSAATPTPKRPRGARLVSPAFGPAALMPPPSEPVVPLPHANNETEAVAATKAEDAAQSAAIATAKEAVTQSSDQLDKFQQIYQDATKIFGAEHTVISPSFFLAGDIKGRLSATEKHQTGLTATLMVPLFGAGGGHGADWFPVIATSDETQIYQGFLDQLSQYEQAETNLYNLGGNVDAILHTKWSIQNLVLAKQLFCKEEMDPELPPAAASAIGDLCSGNLPTSYIVQTVATNDPQAAARTKVLQDEQQTIIAAVTPASPRRAAASPPIQASALAVNTLTSGPTLTSSPPPASTPPPRRQNLLLGPSIAIPLTQNPTDIFQYGASAEFGGEAFRIMASGGLVGRYQGATYKEVFAAGWFAGLALSGQLGDELFHYFNGGSNLLTQLAQIKTNPPVAPQ
jgi:hypothetical protein